MSELTALANADLAGILGKQDQTCTIGSVSGIPCSFTNTGSLNLSLFMEQDQETAKLIVQLSDLTGGVPEPNTLLTAPDGNSYRIKTVNPDGHGVSVLFELQDITGEGGGE
jgi:hypothetical protein